MEPQQPDEVSLRQESEKPTLLLEQLDQHSLYVPGDPGTGKSTFCRWVAWLVAARSLPECDVAAPDGYAESLPKALTDRLPLLIRLRDMWNSLPQNAGRDSLSRAELESALSNWVDSSSPGGLDWDQVSAHLQHGSALLIFDGVDEVPLRIGEGADACYPRAMLLAGLARSHCRMAEGWEPSFGDQPTVWLGTTAVFKAIAKDRTDPGTGSATQGVIGSSLVSGSQGRW